MIVQPLQLDAYAATYDKPNGTPVSAPVTRYYINDEFDISDFFHILSRAAIAVRVHSKDIEVECHYDILRTHQFVVYWSEFPPRNPVHYTLPEGDPFYWNGELVVFRKRNTRGSRRLVNLRAGDLLLCQEAIHRYDSHQTTLT